MFGKVKKILGIESVKVEVQNLEKFHPQMPELKGELKFTTQNDAEIEFITMKVVEKYSRGRKESLLIDEYEIGNIILNEKFTIGKQEIIEIPFTVPVVHAQSEMDQMADQNFLLRGPIKLAKWLKRVKSSYRLSVEVKVKGTKLSPYVEVEL